MMATDQQEQQNLAKPQSEPAPEQDDDLQQFFNKQNSIANTKYKAVIEKLLVTDEFQFNGDTYKYRMLKPKDVGELKRLEQELKTVDMEKDFEVYQNNVCKRACLLIQDMTEEKFNEGDWYVLSTLVLAWGPKINGFRDLF